MQNFVCSSSLVQVYVLELCQNSSDSGLLGSQGKLFLAGVSQAQVASIFTRACIVRKLFSERGLNSPTHDSVLLNIFPGLHNVDVFLFYPLG